MTSPRHSLRTGSTIYVHQSFVFTYALRLVLFFWGNNMNWIDQQMVLMGHEVRRRWRDIRNSGFGTTARWDEVVKEVLRENGFTPIQVIVGMLNDECKRQRIELERRRCMVKDEFPPYTSKRTQRRRFR